MKTLLKKSLSVLLCVVMIASVTVFAFAEEEKTPIILIPGFGQSDTNVYDEDGEFLGEINAFVLPNLDVKELVFDLVLPLIESIASRRDISLSKAAKEEVAKVFKPFLKNDDGSYVYNTVVREFNLPYSQLPSEDRLEVNHHIRMDGFSTFDDVRYYFTYDSFGSIRANAERLHNYLHDVVLAQTGADKAIFVPVSQGGTVFQEFLELYPEDYQHIKKVVSMIPAYDGSVIVGDVLTDNVTVYDLNYVHETVLPSLLGETDAAYAVSLALRFGLSDETTIKVLKAALAAVIDILVTRSSMMWALCPDDEYAVSLDRLLSDPALSAVREECEEFARARANFPSHLQALRDSGVLCHNVVSYESDMLFSSLFKSKGENTDELLAPSSAGLGATAARLGETLGDDYVSPHTYCSDPTHNHISPDGKIDASTGFLPENTWYFKGVGHTTMNSRNDVKTFAVSLILDDSITDIHTSPKLSQFTDPAELIASSEEYGGYTYYYDADGNYMYAEETKADEGGDTSSPITVLGIFHTIVNFIFRILEMLGIHIKQL